MHNKNNPLKPTLQIQKVHHLTGHKAAVFALGEGEPGHFISGAGDGWLVNWNMENPDPGKLIAKVDSNVFTLSYLVLPSRPSQEEAPILVVGNMYGGVHWVNLRESQKTKNILHHKKGVFGIFQVEDFIYTIGGDGVLSKWDIETQMAVESYHLSNQSLRAIDYSEHRNELVIGASDNSLYFLDAGTMELKRHLAKAHQNSVFTVKYHPNGRHLITGGRDALLNVWNLDDNALVSSQAAHMYTINSIAFHPKASIFATASRDRTIKLWDAQNYKLLKVIETLRDDGHLASVNKLLWTSHKDYLISASDDRSVGVWKIENFPN